MENDIRRWIKDAYERKAQEDKLSKDKLKNENILEADNDALKLKRQINEYLHLLSILNGVIELDKKLTEAAFLDFWQRYQNIYNTLNYIQPNPEIDILVSYDNELGLILKPIEEDKDEILEKGSEQNKNEKPYSYNILSIIDLLNQHEQEKEKIILEWKGKIDKLFDFLKNTGDLTAKMNSSDLFDREQLHAEFKKSVKKYIRIHKLDILEKTFYEDNLEQLFEEFDNHLHL